MALVQVRDVPDEVAERLKARAAEQGVSLSAFLRAELERLATRPSNAEVVARLAGASRDDGPSVAETVSEIRAVRDAS
jgi:antitoxin FitA